MTSGHREHEYGNHPDAGFEREDLTPHSVYLFLITLAVSVVLTALLMGVLFAAAERFAKSHQAPPDSPLVERVDDTRAVLPRNISQFPQPRLETNERLEIRDFRLKEEQALNSYGWVDERSGVAHIPIERAMDLIAERGLSTTPRAGTTPDSIVSRVNAAAQAADHSAMSPAKAAKP
jgi:hypothetical protein